MMLHLPIIEGVSIFWAIADVKLIIKIIVEMKILFISLIRKKNQLTITILSLNFL